MEAPQILKGQQINDVFDKAVQARTPIALSYLSRGKWRMASVVINSVTNRTIHVELNENENPANLKVQINQPVGISFSQEESKYLCETLIVGFETKDDQQVDGSVVIEKPQRMEILQRRSFARASVPDSLNVKVIFWHRGYIDDNQEVPVENCWEGSLVDLSVGGMQISISADKIDCFKNDQLVGMQFTPMVYQQPLLIEGQIKHIAETADKENIYLGVEFVGLEATGEGRAKLRRIVNTVDTYSENSNKPLKEPLFGNSAIAEMVKVASQ